MKTLSLFATFMLASFRLIAELPPLPMPPHYQVVVNINDSDLRSNEAEASFQYLVNMPAGDGFTFVPLPFRETAQVVSTVDPGSDYNVVLCGQIRPGREFGLCALQLGSKPSHVLLEFKGVMVPIADEPGDGNTYAIELLFKQACEDLHERLGNESLALLERVEFEVQGFRDSDPVSGRGEKSRRVIKILPETDGQVDIRISVGKAEDPRILYAMLGGMGLLIGLFSAPKIVTTRIRAIAGALLSLAAMGTATYIFFGVLPQEDTDTTTIVTAGTVGGLLLGIFIYSIFEIIRALRSVGR